MSSAPSQFETFNAAAASGLPRALTILIGRERELDEIEHRLVHDHVRLLVLVGPGGVGKTRLAIESAHLVPSHYAWFLFVMSSIFGLNPFRPDRATIGVIDVDRTELYTRLASALGGRATLLVSTTWNK